MKRKDDEGAKKNGEDEKLLILPLNDKSSKKISQVISNDTARAILGVLSDEPLSISDIAETLGIPLTTVQYNIEKLMDTGLVKVERTKWSEKFKEVKIYAPQKKLVVILPEKTSREDAISTLRKYLPVVGFAAVLSGMVEFLSGGFKPLGGAKMMESEAFEGSVLTPSPTDIPEMVEKAGSGVNDVLSDTAGMDQSLMLGTVENVTSQAGGTAPEMANITPSPTAISGANDIVSESNRLLFEAVNVTPSPVEVAEEAIDTGLQTDLFSHIGLWFFLGAISIIAVMFVMEWYRGQKPKKD